MVLALIWAVHRVHSLPLQATDSEGPSVIGMSPRFTRQAAIEREQEVQIGDIGNVVLRFACVRTTIRQGSSANFYFLG